MGSNGFDYAYLEQVLSQLQMGDIASDHRAELAGFQGWNYVAITAACKQATRSLVYVYDDSKDPSTKEVRKSLRAEHGWNWRKHVSAAEHQGILVDQSHELVKLLKRPNPWQTGSSFLWEQIQQLRLHGTCLVWNRPNVLRSRTVQRYVVPMALIQPISPGYYKEMPNGGIRVQPNSIAGLDFYRDIADNFSPIRRVGLVDIPVEMLSIVRYPHPFLRGDGASPTTAASKWIDTATRNDEIRFRFYAKGPNGQIIIQANTSDEKLLTESERVLNQKFGEDGPTVAVIGNGASIAELRTADDMGFGNTHDQMKTAIFATHHISRAMVGDADSMTYGSLAASLMGSTILSIQPDMDLIADEDTLDLAPQYNGQLSIEYEVPSIDDPELQARQRDADATKGVLTVGEYRRMIKMPPFGDERDELMLTSSGPVTVKSLLKSSEPKPPAPPQAGGFPPKQGGPPMIPGQGKQPEQENEQPGGQDQGRPSGQEDPFDMGPMEGEPMEKSLRSLVTNRKRRKGPVIAVEVDGTLCNVPTIDGLPGRIDESAMAAIGLLKQCGFTVEAVASSDKSQEIIKQCDLPEYEGDSGAVLWDRLAAGFVGKDRFDDLRQLLPSIPDSEPLQKLKAKLTPPAKSHEYGCIMLPIPDTTAQAITAYAATIDPAHLAVGGIETYPHLTLLYGLTTNDLKDVSNAVGKMRAPTIMFGDIETFPEGKDGVPLKFAIESKQVHDMNAKVRDMFPHVLLYPEYEPHVTIAYIKPEYASLYTGPSTMGSIAVELDRADVRLIGKPRCIVPLKRIEPVSLSTDSLVPQIEKASTYKQIERLAGRKSKPLRSDRIASFWLDKGDEVRSAQLAKKPTELQKSLVGKWRAMLDSRDAYEGVVIRDVPANEGNWKDIAPGQMFALESDSNATIEKSWVPSEIVGAKVFLKMHVQSGVRISKNVAIVRANAKHRVESIKEVNGCRIIETLEV